MNKLIHELAEQADEYADNKIQMPGEYHPDWHNIRDERFAELIVQDVLAATGDLFANHVSSHASAHNSAILKCQNAIKEHFGMKHE